jgi:predicted secreted hydrolase
MARGAMDLAGTQVDNYFRVWLYDWKVVQISENEFKLTASTEDFSLNLNLEDLKKPIFHGTNGLSIKGDAPGNASYYFSQTRLSSVGEIKIGEEVHTVKGLSWMDHEFGSNTLGANQIGWDWFSLQLDDKQELMLFQIRQNDNSISNNSSGTFVNAASTTKYLDISQFDITVLDVWKTVDGFIYPSKWLIKIDDLDMELIVEPVINQQENDFFFRYWEGAVKFSGMMGDLNISGYGYVELTGYVLSMQGVF